MRAPLSVLLSVFLFSVAFFASCKKDTINEEIQEPEKKPLSSKDPQAVSAAVKVWYGERAAGSLPASHGAGLELDAASSSPITIAFAGRYAIIDPYVSQGEVAGYYLQVNGASEHFKIDYSRPRGGRLRGPNSKTSLFDLPTGGQQRIMNGNADSVIVIALPASLQVPNTLCVTYAAYDDQGNVSNTVTTCLVVNSLGTDAANAWLHGSWKHTATLDMSTGQSDTIIYGRWQPYHADGTSRIYCRYDAGSNQYYPSYADNGTAPLGEDSSLIEKNNITLGSNGGMYYEMAFKIKTIDQPASSCTQLAYSLDFDALDKTSGAWSYDPATGKLIVVLEFTQDGIPALEVWEYGVMKLADNHMLLRDNGVGSTFYWRFQK